MNLRTYQHSTGSAWERSHSLIGWLMVAERLSKVVGHFWLEINHMVLGSINFVVHSGVDSKPQYKIAEQQYIQIISCICVLVAVCQSSYPICPYLFKVTDSPHIFAISPQHHRVML